jgi:hypothetical protein
MKKVKMSIVKWLGIHQEILQLELENERLQSKLYDLESNLDSLESEVGEKMSSWDVEDMISDNEKYLDMYDYTDEIESIIRDYVDDGNINDAISVQVDSEISALADNDTLRELVSHEVDNHPALSANNDSPDNTTWDMNEIVQEVLSELVERLS